MFRSNILATYFLCELKYMHKILGIGRFIFLMLLCSSFSLPFLFRQQDFWLLGSIINLICLPWIILSLAENLIKLELNDGRLYVLLSAMDSSSIIIGKFLSLSLTAIIAAILPLPIIAIVYDNTEIINFLNVFLAQSLLIINVSSLAILISCVQCYFKSNTNFLIPSIIPFMIPGIITNGIIVSEPNFQYILLSVGICLVTVPITIIFSSYLLKNIYNF